MRSMRALPSAASAAVSFSRNWPLLLCPKTVTDNGQRTKTAASPAQAKMRLKLQSDEVSIIAA